MRFFIVGIAHVMGAVASEIGRTSEQKAIVRPLNFANEHFVFEHLQEKIGKALDGQIETQLFEQSEPKHHRSRILGLPCTFADSYSGPLRNPNPKSQSLRPSVQLGEPMASSGNKNTRKRIDSLEFCLLELNSQSSSLAMLQEGLKGYALQRVFFAEYKSTSNGSGNS